MVTVIRGAKFSISEDVESIAGEGQTIWHIPLPDLSPGNDVPCTPRHRKIGVISAKLGLH